MQVTFVIYILVWSAIDSTWRPVLYRTMGEQLSISAFLLVVYHLPVPACGVAGSSVARPIRPCDAAFHYYLHAHDPLSAALSRDSLVASLRHCLVCRCTVAHSPPQWAGHLMCMMLASSTSPPCPWRFTLWRLAALVSDWSIAMRAEAQLPHLFHRLLLVVRPGHMQK